MVSFCGLVCSECPAYIVTQEDNDEKRAGVAQMWSEQYGMEIKPSDINCDGCVSDSKRLIGHCHVCEIRICGKQKGVENCAHCDEYPCATLVAFFKMAPRAKEQLDDIKNSL